MMQRFADDDRQFDIYSSIAGGLGIERPWIAGQSVGVLEWPSELTRIRQIGVKDLLQTSEARLRIIFAPLDVPRPNSVDIVTELLRHFNAPPSFLTERLQSVTHSYGVRKFDDNQYASWFHILCKNLTIQTNDANETRIVDPELDPQALSQSDYSWIKSGFFLSSGRARNGETCTTLVCFGAHLDLERRFEHLTSHRSWQDAVESPFNLFLIILDELFLVLDNKVWDLSDVFRTMETEILVKAQSLDPARQFDFVGLHNVSKHIAYLNEAADAFLLIVEDMQVQCKALPCAADVKHVEEIAATLAYQKGLFHSGKLRLKSLDKRMQNIINLAFNLVTQQDSKVMKRDSDSMKTIAAVTLFFLPMSTVAAVFGMPFFEFGPDSSQNLAVSNQFWVYWAIAIPVTVIVVSAWYLFHRWAIRRLNFMRQRHRP